MPKELEHASKQIKAAHAAVKAVDKRLADGLDAARPRDSPWGAKHIRGNVGQLVRQSNEVLKLLLDCRRPSELYRSEAGPALAGASTAGVAVTCAPAASGPAEASGM